MDELEIKGKKYISSKRASELTGYAKDYVGQLARSGKLPGMRMGRAWYVEKDALLAYQKLDEAAPEAVEQVILEKRVSPAQKNIVSPSTLKALGYLPKSLPSTWSSVAYTYEDLDLLPRTRKQSEPLAPASTAPEVQFSVLEALETPVRIKILENRVSHTAHKIKEVRQVRRRKGISEVNLALGALSAALAVFVFLSAGFFVSSDSIIANNGTSMANIYSGFHAALDFASQFPPIQAGVAAVTGFFMVIFSSFFYFLNQGVGIVTQIFHSFF